MRKAVFVIIGLVSVLTAKVYAYDDGDFQLWHTENQEFKVNKDSKITLEEEFRWGDDAGFSQSMNKHLVLGINYR